MTAAWCVEDSRNHICDWWPDMTLRRALGIVTVVAVTGTVVIFRHGVEAAPAAGPGLTESPSPRMQFFCNTGYSVESCQAHVAALRRVLSTVPLQSLGEWTWVLVRSDDWRPILRRVGRDPDSPAFTILEKRQTFLEEALFVPLAGRSATLLAAFRMPLDRLLEYAVLHELGHAVCAEHDERRTREYAMQLQRHGGVRCVDTRANLNAKNRAIDNRHGGSQ